MIQIYRKIPWAILCSSVFIYFFYFISLIITIIHPIALWFFVHYILSTHKRIHHHNTYTRGMTDCDSITSLTLINNNRGSRAPAAAAGARVLLFFFSPLCSPCHVLYVYRVVRPDKILRISIYLYSIAIVCLSS